MAATMGHAISTILADALEAGPRLLEYGDGRCSHARWDAPDRRRVAAGLQARFGKQRCLTPRWPSRVSKGPRLGW